MDKLWFCEACGRIIGKDKPSNGIGTLSEKTLHAVLKLYFEPAEGNHEIKVGGYVADIVGEHGIIEIQTRSFDRLRKKLESFLEAAEVTVVYPIAETKWLAWIDPETGAVTNKRKSPKTGTPHEVFPELYKIKPYLNHPNFKLCLVMMEIEEYRFLNGYGPHKKRWATRAERLPVSIVRELWLATREDYLELIPPSLQKDFTVKEYKKAAKVSPKTAQTALNVLFHMNVVSRVGKQGNAFIYQRNIQKAKNSTAIL